MNKVNLWRNSKVLSFFISILPLINIIYLIVLSFSSEKLKNHFWYLLWGLVLNFSYLFFIFLDGIEWMNIEWYHFLYVIFFLYYGVSEKYKISEKYNKLIYGFLFINISILPTFIAIILWYGDGGIYDLSMLEFINF